MSRRLLAAFLILLLFLGGCSLFQPQEGPVIPTPLPTVAPAVSFAELELVTNPVSSIAPSVDPDVDALMNAVSQQQLLAYVQTLENFGTRNTFSDTQREDFGIGAARRWIFSEFERVGGGALQVEFDDFTANIDGITTPQRNIVATLPGTGEYPGSIILSAHYDSRSFDPNNGVGFAPGADDNGSGVAMLLELARLLSARTWNQTIKFVSFAAEEQGSHGSRHYVQDAMLGGDIVDFVINNDIVGGRPGIPQSIRVFSQGPDTSDSRRFARYMDYIGGMYIPAFRVDVKDTLDREGRWSDHREFVNAGVPAVRLTESEEDRDHQHGGTDTHEKIDYDYLRQVAQLNLVVVANLAGAPTTPTAPTIAAMADPGSYILTWLPDPLAAGYAIAFRPVDTVDYPPFHFVSASEAGNVALTDLDPFTTFAVSMAAIDASGRIGGFSQEVLIGPTS